VDGLSLVGGELLGVGIALGGGEGGRVAAEDELEQGRIAQLEELGGARLGAPAGQPLASARG